MRAPRLAVTLILTVLTFMTAGGAAAQSPYLVRDINPRPAAGGSNPADLMTFGNLAIFTTNDGEGVPREVWRSDGTAAGTFKLGGGGRSMAIWNGKLWFIGADGTLFSSDGTTSTPFPLPDGVRPYVLIPSGQALYFGAGNQLWRTDGTAAGTVSAATLTVDTGAGTAMLGQTAIFSVRTPGLPYDTCSLWRAGSTVEKITTFDAGLRPINLVAAGPYVYFHLLGFGAPLYRTDGTAAGTIFLTAWNGDRIFPSNPVYFQGDGLMRSDGTEAGTITAPNSPPPDDQGAVYPLAMLTNDTLIALARPEPFVQQSPNAGLWAYDGASSRFLANVPNSAFRTGTAAGNLAVVAVGKEVWRSDGTAAGTYKLADLTVQEGNPNSVYDGVAERPLMTTAGSTILFSATDAACGRELRKTQGTVATTAVVKDIVTGTFPSSPRQLRPLNHGVVFTTLAASDAEYGALRDLWFSDGFESGTVLLHSSLRKEQVPVCGGRAYFTRSSAVAKELWSTNGTTTGTAAVKAIGYVLAHPTPEQFNCVDGRLLFLTAAGGPRGIELWRSDGSAAGTFMLHGFSATSRGVQPPVRYGHAILFGMRASYDTDQLWSSNGAPGGTKLLEEFPPNAVMGPIVVAGAYAYFTVDSKLWWTDGSSAGDLTIPVQGTPADLHEFDGRLAFRVARSSGSSDSYCAVTGVSQAACFDERPAIDHALWRFSMKPLNGALYYNTPELLSTNGQTAAATGAPDAVALLGATGGRLYYVQGNDHSQLPLLESDGTAAGTQTLFTSPAVEVAPSGGRLFIAGDELYAYDLRIATTTLVPSAVPASTGGQVVIHGRGLVLPVTVLVGNEPVSVVSATASAITFTAPPREPGAYEVEVHTADGRHLTPDEELTYTCSPLVAVIGPVPQFCRNVPVTLQGSGGTHCSWSPATGLSDALSCTPKATLESTTTYTLTVRDDNGCASTNQPTITLTPNPLPSAYISWSGSFPFYPGGTYGASVPDAGPGATYSWIVAGAQLNGPANARTVSFTAHCRPRLTVTVTGANGCLASSVENAPMSNSLSVSSATPQAANTGAVVTVAGSAVGCATSVMLADSRYWSAGTAVAFTAIDFGTVSFRMPANAPSRSYLHVRNQLTAATNIPELRHPVNGDWTYVSRDPATGSTLIWYVERNGLVSSSRWLRDAGTTDYSVIGAYDFGLEGHAPGGVLSQRASTRELVVQLFSAWYFTDKILPLVPPADLTVAAVGDLDGNGYIDLIMRNTTTGQTLRWALSADLKSIAVTPIHKGENLTWNLVTSRDFDGDGKADILWRESKSGMTLVWLMDGTAIRSSKVIHPGGNTDWFIAAAGDFDGDANTDILWRHTATGRTLIWRMNGGQILQSTMVHLGGNPTWTVAGAAHYDGDTKADIVWRDTAAGTILCWHMNGAQIASTTYFRYLPGYEIESPGM